MAILAGDEVAIHRDPALETLGATGRVLFGVADAVGANVAVLWENGIYDTAVPAAALDQVIGANGAQDVFTFTDGADGVDSPSYQGILVRKYTRNPAGAGTPVQFALLRLLPNGELVELPSAVLQSIPGR